MAVTHLHEVHDMIVDLRDALDKYADIMEMDSSLTTKDETLKAYVKRLNDILGDVNEIDCDFHEAHGCPMEREESHG